MAASVYLDESKAHGFYMAGAALPPSRITEVRRMMRSLHLPGQDRLHMKSERDSQRHKILDAICSLGIDIVIYDGSNSGKTQIEQRMACIAAVIADAARLDHRRLVFERDDTLVQSDKRTIIEASRRQGIDLGYAHLRASEDSVLAVPDAAVWAWARGGAWRQQLIDSGVVLR